MARILDNLSHFFLGVATEKPPFLLEVRSSTVFIVATVCLSIFTDIFLYGLIVPVIPFSLTMQLGTPEDEVQEWTAILLACYSVALFVGSPIAGFYADMTHSRRLPLLLGLFALAGSTLLLMLGTTIAVLIIGRIMQGLSAAIVWSVGLALMADTMGSSIGVAMGYVSISMTMGLLTSPIVGGAVYDAAGYYAVYYVAFGIIFLDIVLRLLLVEKKVALQWVKQEESSLAVTQEVQHPGQEEELRSPEPDGQTQSPEAKDDYKSQPEGEESETRERGTVMDASPGIPPRKRMHRYLVLVRSKRMIAALYGIATQAGIVMAFDTVLPLFVQQKFDWNATEAGLAFLCLFLPTLISPLVGWLSDRYGPVWLSVLGFIASVPLLVCLRFVARNTIGDKVLFGALLALVGVTLAFANTPLMAEISYIIEDKERNSPGVFGKKGIYGAAYGLFNTFFALGGTVGSLASGYLVDGPGWGTAMWVLAVWCTTGAVVVGMWVGGGLKKNPLKFRRKDHSGKQGTEVREASIVA